MLPHRGNGGIDGLEQFRAFVQATRHQTDAEKAGYADTVRDRTHGKFDGVTWANALPDQTESHPVTCVSWNDAAGFCTWLSRKAGDTCQLPTEAQWEYVCRAGTSTRYSAGDPDTALRGIANYADKNITWPWADKEHNDGFAYTAPVGRFRANAWGLHDMHGNVWEWCADWYGENTYKTSPTSDPGGAAEGRSRVLRGGGWSTFAPHLCRSAARAAGTPSRSNAYGGFRVVVFARTSR